MDQLGLVPKTSNLKELGLGNVDTALWNLTPADLTEETILRGQGVLSDTGALVINTGEFTGRSPKDRFVVCDEKTEDSVYDVDFNQPIAIIPNGVEPPPSTPESTVQSTNHKTILFLSRIHPVKGLLNLVRAWRQLKDQAGSACDDWKLVLAGPDENGHQREVESLALELGVDQDIAFVGSVDEQAKWQLYHNADLFVLPSFSENFGIVIAEALASGLGIIASDHIGPVSIIGDTNASCLFDESDATSIVELLTRCSGDRSYLLEYRKRFSHLATQYKIENVAQQWNDALKFT